MSKTRVHINPKLLHFLADKELIEEMDGVCALLNWNRSVLIRSAIRSYLKVALEGVARIQISDNNENAPVQGSVSK